MLKATSSLVELGVSGQVVSALACCLGQNPSIRDIEDASDRQIIHAIDYRGIYEINALLERTGSWRRINWLSKVPFG